MNKRQVKKQYKKYLKEIEAEFSVCQECGKSLDLDKDEYHRRFGTCNEGCYMSLVGLSYSDFY